MLASVNKKYFSFAAIFLAAALGLSSIAAMVADLSAYQAKRFELRWQKKGTIESSQHWYRGYSYLDTALGYAPSHPDYLQTSGRFYSWLFWVDGITPNVQKADAVDQAEMGLKYFRQATQARPYWPYAWSELALLKAQANQVDDEFWQAFVNAKNYGPNEKQVILNLLNAGIGSWFLLDWPQKSAVLKLFYHALTLNYGVANPALVIAEGHKMKAALCYGLDKTTVTQSIAQRCR
jgi:hypothetical protein